LPSVFTQHSQIKAEVTTTISASQIAKFPPARSDSFKAGKIMSGTVNDITTAT
jgi:hypothetical protein